MRDLFLALLHACPNMWVHEVHETTERGLTLLECKYIKGQEAFKASTFSTQYWLSKDIKAIRSEINRLEEVATIIKYRNSGEMVNAPWGTPSQLKQNLKRFDETLVHWVSERHPELFGKLSNIQAVFIPLPAVMATVSDHGRCLGSVTIAANGMVTPCFRISSELDKAIAYSKLRNEHPDAIESQFFEQISAQTDLVLNNTPRAFSPTREEPTRTIQDHSNPALKTNSKATLAGKKMVLPPSWGPPNSYKSKQTPAGSVDAAVGVDLEEIVSKKDGGDAE